MYPPIVFVVDALYYTQRRQLIDKYLLTFGKMNVKRDHQHVQ